MNLIIFLWVVNTFHHLLNLQKVILQDTMEYIYADLKSYFIVPFTVNVYCFFSVIELCFGPLSSPAPGSIQSFCL